MCAVGERIPAFVKLEEPAGFANGLLGGIDDIG